jgi:sugar phosphate isomerase/epimerase
LGDNLSVHELPPEDLTRLRDYAGASGIGIELGTVGTEPEHLLRYLDLALFFGARLIRTLLRTPGGEADLAEKSIRYVVGPYRSSGVVLALENYEQHTSAQLRALVERIGDPCVGICLDAVNSLGALETLQQVVETLGPYVRNLHIKDFTIRRLRSMMGFEVTGCPVGEGKLDIQWLLRELQKRGAEPTVILEQWTPWTGNIEETVTLEEEWAARSIHFLERYR